MAEAKEDEPVKKIAEAASQAARAESEPAPVRRYRAVLLQAALVVVAVAFAGLTWLVKAMPFFTVDLQITRTLQRLTFPPFAFLMRLISWPGYSPQDLILAGVIILLVYSFGLHWEAVMALIAAVSTTALDVFVKDWIQRPRPAPSQVNVYLKLTSFSFPSGHVMFYLGFYGFIWFLAFGLLKPSIKRSLILALVGALVILIGFSRVYLGEHWASDVLGSYLLGTLALTALIQIYRWGKTRFFVHQPVAANKNQQA